MLPSNCAERLFQHAPKHVENRKLDERHRRPEREPVQLVIALVAIRLKQVLFQIARVLADEIRNDQPVQNRVQHVHAAVIHRNPLRAVLRPDADEMIAALAQQFDGFDDDRIFERADLQHRLRGSVSRAWRL